MTKADSVLSTPPTNTSALPVDPTRRHLLTIAAGGAVAAAIPTTVVTAAAATEPDPVFATIERYKVLSAEYTAAVDRSAPLEPEDPDYLEAEDETERTGTALFEQMDLIFSFRPSTVAGVAALLKYITTLKDWQMAPGLEDGEGAAAVETLCTCLAEAIEQSGVQS